MHVARENFYVSARNCGQLRAFAQCYRMLLANCGLAGIIDDILASPSASWFLRPGATFATKCLSKPGLGWDAGQAIWAVSVKGFNKQLRVRHFQKTCKPHANKHLSRRSAQTKIQLPSNLALVSKSLRPNQAQANPNQHHSTGRQGQVLPKPTLPKQSRSRQS